MLTSITVDSVTQGILDWMKEIAEKLVEEGLISEEEITIDTKPGVLTTSIILVPQLVVLQEKLGIEIPDNCYPFFDSKTHQQLSIVEAAKIITKKAHHAGQITREQRKDSIAA